MATKHGTVVLEPVEVTALRQRIAVVGEARVCKETDTSRDSLARAVGELPIRKGTAALIRIGLAKTRA